MSFKHSLRSYFWVFWATFPPQSFDQYLLDFTFLDFSNTFAILQFYRYMYTLSRTINSYARTLTFNFRIFTFFIILWDKKSHPFKSLKHYISEWLVVYTIQILFWYQYLLILISWSYPRGKRVWSGTIDSAVRKTRAKNEENSSRRLPFYWLAVGHNRHLWKLTNRSDWFTLPYVYFID